MYRKDNKNEFFTRKAREEGFVARSVYKLQEIDKKYDIFHRNDRVLDFGAAPGSWMQYIAERVGPKGFVWGIDLADLKTKVGVNVKFEKKDVLTLAAEDLGRDKFNVVVSDLAPSTTGISSLDAGLSYELSSKAFELSLDVLALGGSFVAKVFESERVRDLEQSARQYFSFVKLYRPQAVRSESREEYMVCKNFNRDGR